MAGWHPGVPMDYVLSEHVEVWQCPVCARFLLLFPGER